MNVADEVDGELERLDLGVARRATQLVLEAIELGDDAIALLGIVHAVPIWEIVVGADRNVDEMPVRCRATFGADIVRPTCDRGERPPVQQLRDRRGGLPRQARLCDFRDDRMAFLTPGQRLADERARECDR